MSEAREQSEDRVQGPMLLSRKMLVRFYLARVPIAGLCFLTAVVGLAYARLDLGLVFGALGVVFCAVIVRGLGWLHRKAPQIVPGEKRLVIDLPMIGAVGSTTSTRIRSLFAKADGRRPFVQFSLWPMLHVVLYKHWFVNPADFDRLIVTLQPRAEEMEIRTNPVNRGVSWISLLALSLVVIHLAGRPTGIAGTMTQEHLLLWGALARYMVYAGEWGRLVTGGLLHISWMHLFLNLMIVALTFGEIERAVGAVRTTLLVVLGGVLSATAALLFMRLEIVVGASGIGYAGVGVAAYVLAFRRHLATFLLRVQSVVFFGVLLTIDLVVSYFVPEISFSMHLGGLVGGFLTTWLLDRVYGLEKSNTPMSLKMVTFAALALVAFAISQRIYLATQPSALQDLRQSMLASGSPGLVNSAAYAFATAANVDRARLVESSSKLIEVTKGLTDPTQRAGVEDTIAVLAYRLGDVRSAQTHGERAFESASSVSVTAGDIRQLLAARVGLYDLAVGTVVEPSRQGVQVELGDHQICFVSASRVSLRAVGYRAELPVGVMIGEVNGKECVDRSLDRVTVTTLKELPSVANKATKARDVRYFSISPDAKLPPPLPAD